MSGTRQNLIILAQIGSIASFSELREREYELRFTEYLVLGVSITWPDQAITSCETSMHHGSLCLLTCEGDSWCLPQSARSTRVYSELSHILLMPTGKVTAFTETPEPTCSLPGGPLWSIQTIISSPRRTALSPAKESAVLPRVCSLPASPMQSSLVP